MEIKGFEKQTQGSQYGTVTANLLFGGEEKKLRFLTEKANVEYFCDDRIDGIVVMLLPELLLRGENVVSNLPMSEKLYYNLSRAIPLLVRQSKGRFKEIEIRCPLTRQKYDDEGRHGATGMSFGIDSLYSYCSHNQTITPPLRFSAISASRQFSVGILTFFNHGALNGQYTNSIEQMRAVFERGREKVRQFADIQGVGLLTVDTNLDEFYSLNYTRTHTFRTAGLALCFQRLISNYFYSSGYYGDSAFSIAPFEDSAYYDIFSLPILGTESTGLYSDGYEVDRFEKTRRLSATKEAQQWLSVCWRDLDNCGECPKCVRTLAALELLGRLDDFTAVFDIEKYRQRRDWHWAKIISLKNNDIYYRELYLKARETGFAFSAKSRFMAFVFSCARTLFSPRLLNKIQSRVSK